MAASDQHYRSQKTLDIVFGVSCVVMLLTIAWMFAQDYFKDFKSEQRVFRDVETAVAQRDLADQLAAMMHSDAALAVQTAEQKKKAEDNEANEKELEEAEAYQK